MTAAITTFRLPVNDEWTAERACQSYPFHVFFPERGQSTKQARQACESCPVRSECAATAIVTGTQEGIWGGMSPKERRRIRRRCDIIRMCRNGCGRDTLQRFRGQQGHAPPHTCHDCEGGAQ